MHLKGRGSTGTIPQILLFARQTVVACAGADHLPQEPYLHIHVPQKGLLRLLPHCDSNEDLDSLS